MQIIQLTFKTNQMLTLVVDIYIIFCMTQKDFMVDIGFHKPKIFQQLDSIQPIIHQPTLFNQLFTFEHLKVYLNFLKDVSIHNFRKYIPQFEPMIKSTTIWEKCITAKEDTTAFMQILKSEKRALLAMIIFGILAGFTLLVGVYLQFPLYDAIKADEKQQAWKYGGIMIAIMFLKNFLFSYTERLANNISINFQIHMENTFIKSVLEAGSPLSKEKLENVYFYNIPKMRQLILFIPYLTVNAIQVLGGVVFIIIYESRYGFITIGMFVLMILIHLFLFCWMNRVKKQTVETTENRSGISARNFRNLLQVSFQGMTIFFYKFIESLRKKQAQTFGKYSLLYSITQMIGDAYPTITMIIYFTIARDQQMHNGFNYNNAIRIAAFLGTMYFPIKVSLLGYTIVLSSMSSVRQINKMMNFKRFTKFQDKTLSKHAQGLMADDLGQCYRGTHEEQELFIKEYKVNQLERKFNTLELQFKQRYNWIKKGQTILITGRIDCQPSTDQYLAAILVDDYKTQIVAVIDRNPFILDATIKNNITLYQNFYEQTYRQSLKIVGIYDLIQSFDLKDDTLITSYSVKQFKWLTLRIELARALYHDVQILVVKRGLNYQQELIVKDIFKYRKIRKRTNIILHHVLNMMDVIDYVVVIKTKDKIYKGSPQQLLKQPNLQFGQMFCNDFNNKGACQIKITHQDDKNIEKYIKAQLEDVIPPVISNSKALAIVHHKGLCGSFFVLSAIFITAFLKQYIIQQVPLSNLGPEPHNTLYVQFLSSCIVFLLFVILRGIILSFSFTQSSTELSMRLFRKFYSLTIQQIFKLYNRRQTAKTQIYLSNLMNENWFRDTEVGYFVFYQIIGVISFNIIKTFPMVVVSPLFLLSLITSSSIYIITLTKILNYKNSVMNSFNYFVSNIIEYRRAIIYYKKSTLFFKQFIVRNKPNIIFDLNDIWGLIGERFINQFFCIFFFFVLLIIMIHSDFDKSENRTYSLLMTTSLGLVNDVSNGVRYFLKLKRHFQILLIGVSQVLKIIEDEPVAQASVYRQRKLVNNFNTIQFRDVTLKVLEMELFRRVSFTLNHGDRVIVTGDDSYGKQGIFGLLHNIYTSKSIIGEVVIDNTSFKECYIEGFNVIHFKPLFPQNFTVYQAMRMHRDNLSQDQLQSYIEKIFAICDLQRTFDTNTKINDLLQAQKDLLVVIEQAMIRKCQMLMIVQGLVYLDKISSQKILKYLISCRYIKVLIHITNNPSVIQLYNKKLIFIGNTIKQIAI